MDAFLVSLVMVFLAELGDKTQLVALILAGRYSPLTVLTGILVATGAAHVISVAGGALLGSFLAGPWLPFLAGISFLLFGVWTLRGDSAEEDGIRDATSPFLVVFWTFLMAEMGDKTMLATASIAAEHRSAYLPVWLGSTLGMVLSDGLAIGIGWLVGTRLPDKGPRLVAAVVFLLFGLWSVWTGGRELPPAAWVGGGIVVLGCTLILYRGSLLRRGEPED